MSPDVKLFPITGWEASSVSAHDAVILRFQYLSSPMQSEEEPHTSPALAISRTQAQELIDLLQSQLKRLDGPSPSTPLH